MKIVVNGEICDLAVCVFNFVTRFVVIANKSRLSVRFAILVKKWKNYRTQLSVFAFIIVHLMLKTLGYNKATSGSFKIEQMCSFLSYYRQNIDLFIYTVSLHMITLRYLV